MEKRQLLLNAATSCGQVLVMGASLFFLYRYLLRTIGVEQLGIWSVVLATSSAASVAKKGVSGSAVKYVARYLARGEKETVARVIQTTAVSIGVFAAIALLVTYPLAKWILALIVPAEKLGMAHAILPYALLSLWLMMLGSCYYAALDGFQRTDLRSWVLMGGSFFLLALAYVVVPLYGLMGLAYAQVAQSLFILLFSWALLKSRLRALPFFPRKWDKPLFKEMVGYGLNLQLINIFQTLSDPLTKALLTKFGGLSMTGFYEMASRMVVQLRTLIVAANQAMVPTIADLQEKGSELIQGVYKKSYRLILYISVPFFSAVAVFIPAVSHVWIGHYEKTFVVFSYILTIGWFFNTLISPSYFSNLGVGEVRSNTIGHAVIAALNVMLCFALGSLFGGAAVVVGWTISLDAGSLLITYIYHKRYRIPLSELLPREHAVVAAASLAGLGAAFGGYHLLAGRLNTPAVTGVMALVYACFVAVPLWSHPMRRKLAGWISEAFFKVRTAGLSGERVYPGG
jgi:O-antigen/teichoic acid export membrane protein